MIRMRKGVASGTGPAEDGRMEATLPTAVPRRASTAAREGLIEALHRSRLEELEELHRQHDPERHVSLIGTWIKGWLRSAPRAKAEPLPEVAKGELCVSFAGHATALVRYANLSIACDPMLGGHLGVIKRAVQPGLSSAEMRDCDLILISNAHPDHLHRKTLRRLPNSATVVVPPRSAGLISDLGFARVVELGIGQTLSHRGVEIASAPVRRLRSGGRAACAYVVRGDGPSVFFCGASGYFSGFAEVGARYRPDIALLPISGYLPRSFREEHMSPLDALYAFEDLGARMMIPIRYGAFQLSYERLDEPVAWLRRLVADRGLEPYVTLLPAGSSRKFVSGK
jgi:L-ascorbate metabolism protein UlaG (beta-lactamase superfamily)